MGMDKIRAGLWNDEENVDRGSAQYSTMVFEQYKLYVESADRSAAQRSAANVFFLSINSLVAAAIAGFWSHPPDANPWLLLFPLSILEAMCYFWFRLIGSYRQLAGVKWQVVGALEERLPASPWLKAEWKAGLEEGTDRSVYWPLTHLEKWIPRAFGLAYLVGTIAILSAEGCGLAP